VIGSYSLFPSWLFSLAFVAALAGCGGIASANATPIQEGAIACLNYMSSIPDGERVDDILASQSWKASPSNTQSRNLVRHFKKDDIALVFGIQTYDVHGNKMAATIVSCFVSTEVDTESKAILLVDEANQIVGLRAMSPHRYATEPGAKNRIAIGYGPFPKPRGGFIVMIEMYGGPPSQ
jgi:hypothetical protein